MKTSSDAIKWELVNEHKKSTYHYEFEIIEKNAILW